MTQTIDIAGVAETGPAIVTLVGEFDVAVEDTLNNQIDDALSTHPPALIVDLGAVTFIDSTALNALVRANRLCRTQGIPLIVRRPSQRVRQLFAITATDRLFLVDNNA
jgi:anti-sigma B factor antagonist